MYDALLLKASKRKFQCLDISTVLRSIRPYIDTRIPLPPFHPPSSTTSSDPHRDRKVGINVNRMSARPRKTAFAMVYQRGPCFTRNLHLSSPRILLSLVTNAFSSTVLLSSFFPVTCQAHAEPRCYSGVKTRARTPLLRENRRKILERDDPSPTMIYQLDRIYISSYIQSII